jgi:hypothetical protein
MMLHLKLLIIHTLIRNGEAVDYGLSKLGLRSIV